MVERKEETDVEMEMPVIYYDDYYYYFVKDYFWFICIEAGMEEKSILYVKQQLADEDALNKALSSISSSIK